VALAQSLPEQAFRPLVRLPRYEIAAEPRTKRERVKEGIVRAKGYQNKKLVGESVAESTYRPHKRERDHRLVVLRKNISVQKGDTALIDEVRYFFYITNLRPQHVSRRSDGGAGQPALRPEKRHRATEERGECDAHAGGRSDEQLGL